MGQLKTKISQFQLKLIPLCFINFSTINGIYQLISASHTIIRNKPESKKIDYPIDEQALQKLSITSRSEQELLSQYFPLIQDV